MSLTVYISLLITLFVISSAEFSSYSQIQLSEEYVLFWNVDNESIKIKLQVNTLGWIAFGIGEQTSGSMPGSNYKLSIIDQLRIQVKLFGKYWYFTLGGDIVTGFVNGSVGTITDRYALGFVKPLEDICQDWKLISFQETNTSTIMEITRKLVTNDTQDRPILSG